MTFKFSDLKRTLGSTNVNSKLLPFIGLSIIIIIFTFPNINNWTYGKGIDDSLIWVFNHLFEVNWKIGKNIIFPHGPLAFFMYPTGDRIYIAMLVLNLLKISLFIAVYFSFEKRNKFTIYLAFLIAYALSVVSGFNHLLLSTIIFNYCAFYNTEIKYFKIVAFVLSSLAVFIKAYVAILSIIISLSYQIYIFINYKKIKDNLTDIGIISFLILGIWLILYKSFNGFFHFLVGMVNLAGDNSSAASYYPENNWVYLGIAFISTGFFLLIRRDKRSVFYLSLIILSLFAAWKYGIAREDFYHQQAFIVFVSTILIASIVFVPDKRIAKLFFGFLSITFLIANAQNSVNNQKLNYSINRSNHFYNFILNFNSIDEISEQTSLRNAEKSKIPDEVKNIIGHSKIDIYPWEYSFIPVNKLNWEPRVVIQSYASYTNWLDQNNSSHFNSANAPEFIIWEKKKVSSEYNGNSYASIDNRYLLNDEPNTILSIIANYKTSYSNDNIILLEKLNKANPISKREMNSFETKWGEWIKIPESKSDLLRAKVHFKKSILQRVKSFLYKDEQFWVYIKLSDGRIHNYRIVPKNAEDGLWINPYIYNDEKIIVDEIMFVNSNHKIIADKLKVTFEEINFNKTKCIEDFFTLIERQREIICAYNYNFETASWLKEQDSIELIGRKSSIKILKNPPIYDLVFKYSLDSLELGSTLNIAFDAWIMKSNLAFDLKSNLVFSIENEEKVLLYQSIPLRNQIIDDTIWNHIYANVIFKHSIRNSLLKIYILNPENSNYELKDLNIIML